MSFFDTLRDQMLKTREMTVNLLKGIGDERADEMPPTWKNNARWHTGHLVITPRLLTFGLMKEELGVPQEYRKWFAKGSSPKDWAGDTIPSYSELIEAIVPTSETLFENFCERFEAPFPESYTTPVGVVLKTPAEALNRSLTHDGIHLGLLLALRRGLG
ncbi:MAG: DinB family protein [bacterium]